MKPYSFRLGIVVASLSFLACGVDAAFAHGAQNARAPYIEHIAKIKDRLALDTSQQLLWDQAFAQSLAARETARGGGVRLRDTMRMEIAKTEPDLARIAALADEVQANTQAARRRARDEWLGLYATLAPDQKTIVRDLVKKRLERFARFAAHRRERGEHWGPARLF